MGAPSTAHINNYANDLKHLVQQRGSFLRNTVMIDTNFTGEYKFYDQLGAAGAMNERTTRFEDTIVDDANHERRRLSKRFFTKANFYDDYDGVNMALDPTSGYTQSLVWSASNTIDDRIIAAVTGAAYSGKAGGTSEALPSSQIIANGGTSWTIAKLLEAQEILNGNNVDPSEEKYFVVGPKQVTAMMNEIKYTSKDYMDMSPLLSGKLVNYHGFNFIMSNRLASADGIRDCLVYTKTAIQSGYSKDISVSVKERPDKNDNIQILVKLVMDATRLEEEKVVKVQCSEA